MDGDKKLLLIGAAGYPLLELLWRGRTHWSMAAVGGLGLAALGRVSRCRCALWLRCLLGGAALIGLEFLSGCVLNRWLGLGVWDYSRRRGQVLGQICPAYALLWTVIAAPAVLLLSRRGRYSRGRCMR